MCLSAVSRIEAVTTTGQMGSVIRLKQFLEVTETTLLSQNTYNYCTLVEVQKVTALLLALVLFKQDCHFLKVLVKKKGQRYFAHS